MRGATGVIHQRHKVLLLPRKMTRIIDPRDIWNVIYNARSNRCHTPTSSTAPACHVKWLSWLMPVTYETSFTMRGATGITLQPHQILRLPRKITLQNLREICRKQLNDIYMADDSTMIRTWSDHDPTMKLQNWTRPFAGLTFPPSATHFVLKITTFRAPAIHPILRLPQKVTLQDHQILCLPRKVTLQDHQMLRLPRKVTLEDHQILPLPRKMNWNFAELLLYWAGTLLSWYFTLLNCYFTEPVLYWAGTNVTKYCTCRVEWLSWLMSVTYETSFTMRGATGVIHQRHQVLLLPRKMTRIVDPRGIWNVIYNARSNRCHTPTSPSTAPAT